MIFLKSEKNSCEPKKTPQKSKIAGEFDLFGEKGLFILAIVTPNRVESGEIFQTAFLFFISFPSVLPPMKMAPIGPKLTDGVTHRHL